MARKDINEYPSDMLAAVQDWVVSVPLTSAQIAEAAGVNKWWVDRMRRKAIPDPGVRRVQALHDAMLKHQGGEVRSLTDQVEQQKEELARQKAALADIERSIQRFSQDLAGRMEAA